MNDDLRWSKVPADQAEEWDEFYRVIAAQLIAHNVREAAAVVEFDGEPLMISITIEKRRLH
jgi:hypothetical protein